MSITKDKLQASGTAAMALLPDVLMLCGSAAVSAGVGMIHAPAGYITAGLFMLLAGYLLARGGR